MENMSDYVFIQDGAPAHKAKLTQQWCQDNLRLLEENRLAG